MLDIRRCTGYDEGARERMSLFRSQPNLLLFRKMFAHNDSFLRRVLLFLVFQIFYAIQFLKDLTAGFFEFLEDAETGIEVCLTEDFGFEITKFDPDEI